MELKKYVKLIQNNRLLVLIVLIGAIFRFSGIFWGVVIIDQKVFHYHPDEPKIIEGAYDFPRHILTNQDLRYPTAFHYGLGIITLPLKLLPFPADYVAIFMIGRLLSWAAGVLTIILVAALADLLWGAKHSTLAAFLIAFSMLHMIHSAYATTDVMTAFWLSLCLVIYLVYRPIDDYKKAIFLAIPLGLTVGTKYPGAIVCVPLFIFWLIDKRRDTDVKSWWRAFLCTVQDRYFWVTIFTSLVIFLVSTPGIWLKPRSFLASVESENLRLTQSNLPLYDPRIYLAQFKSLADGQGFLIALTSLMGIALNLFKPKPARLALLVMLLVYCLGIGDAMLTRYWVLVLPILTLFAADFLVMLWSLSGRRSQVVGRILVLAVCIQAFFYSLAAVISRYPDTRTQASKYIMENIPTGSSIGIGYTSPEYPWKIHRWRYPPIDFDRYQYRDFLDKPEFIILSSFDFLAIRNTLQSGLLDKNYNLPQKFNQEWYQSEPPTQEIFKLNEGLWLGTIPEYCLLKSFKPSHKFVDIEFSSPTIEIYSTDLVACKQAINK
jgi:hypothetical protein